MPSPEAASIGETHTVSQSYCLPGGGHRNQLAYDFVMQIGLDVVAARLGTVREVRQDLPDDGMAANSSIHNHIMMEHADGTAAFYFGVYRTWPPMEGRDVAVNFSNAAGPLDERGGLIERGIYTALPY